MYDINNIINETQKYIEFVDTYDEAQLDDNHVTYKDDPTIRGIYFKRIPIWIDLPDSNWNTCCYLSIARLNNTMCIFRIKLPNHKLYSSEEYPTGDWHIIFYRSTSISSTTKIIKLFLEYFYKDIIKE